MLQNPNQKTFLNIYTLCQYEKKTPWFYTIQYNKRVELSSPSMPVRFPEPLLSSHSRRSSHNNESA